MSSPEALRALVRRARAWWRWRVAVGGALMGVDVFYDPSRRQVIELEQEEILRREEDDEGDGDGDDDGDGSPAP